MSLAVAVWTNEGIVMGSDSRITFSDTLSAQPIISIQTGHYFDTQDKTFVGINNCGISTTGDAALFDSNLKIFKNIKYYINEFLRSKINKTTSVLDTATLLLKYINSISHDSNVQFLVAGYSKTSSSPKQEAYMVQTGANSNISKNLINGCGARWIGQIETLSRLIKTIYVNDNAIEGSNINFNGNNIGDVYILNKNYTSVYVERNTPWEYMSLQDAIDFVRYAINTTIDTMKFTNINKTVGGPIDILVIKPTECKWISKKDLR